MSAFPQSIVDILKRRQGLPGVLQNNPFVSDASGLTGQSVSNPGDDSDGTETSQVGVPPATTVAPIDTSRLPQPKVEDPSVANPPAPQMPPTPVQQASPNGLPPENPLSSQRRAQEQGLIDKAAGNVITADPGLPKPNIWRQLAGAALRTPFAMGAQPFADVAEYGPSGLRQIQQHNDYIKHLPQQTSMADTLIRSQEAERTADENRQVRADTAKAADDAKRVAAYDTAMKDIKQTDGVPYDGKSPLQPGEVQQSVLNPHTGTVESYIIPSREEAQRRKTEAAQVGWLTVTPEMVDMIGKETGITAGQKFPPDVFKALDEMATKKIKDPNLHIVTAENKENGDQTITAIDPIKGTVVNTVVVKGAAKDRPPQGPQALLVGPDGILSAVRPGQQVPQGAMTPQQLGTQNSPTAQERNMGGMAETVLTQTPQIIKQVQDLKTKLGPAVGRWNDLWVNRAGLDDPAFAGLDQDLDLLASAIVRTHFGARGGQAYQAAMKKDFTEAQSPDDLISRIQHAEGWLKGYAEAGKSKVESKSRGTTDLPQGGGKVLDKDTAMKFYQAAGSDPAKARDMAKKAGWVVQ